VAILLIFLASYTDFRGIWVPRWSLDDGKEIFAHLDGKFNHIFLQVYALGQAYYPSARVPNRRTTDEWLKDFITEAHYRGIKVSAWINVYYSWGYASVTNDRRHPVNRQPNWFVSDHAGRSILDYSVDELESLGIEGYYLSPAHLHVREYICGIAEEIVRTYDFDGIHLDYIRYPGRRFIYDTAIRSKFMRRHGIDPLALRGNSEMQQRYSAWGCEDLEAKWQGMVHHDLTEFIAELSSRIKQVRQDLQVSVAVKPDYLSARTEYYQDWLTWVNAHYVDFVCLMLYTRNITSHLDKIGRVIHDPGRITVGLGLYMLSPEKIGEQVRTVEKSPFAGVVYFSYDQLKENHTYRRALK
jgi:uncharacterized lipoprotein YddW (UPF0748 family)